MFYSSTDKKKGATKLRRLKTFVLSYKKTRKLVVCADGATASSTRNRTLRFHHVFLCYLTPIPFKCSISITLILNYNRTSVKVSKRTINNIKIRHTLS